MHFTPGSFVIPIKEIHPMFGPNGIYSAALEAMDTSKIVDAAETTMQVTLITDKTIQNSNVKQVTSPVMFNGKVPTEDGLFSEYIFGTTPDERRRVFGYIDLHRKFFHPFIYETLKRLMPNIDKCAAGIDHWWVDAEGKLQKVTDKDDPHYNEDATGLDWLIANYKKLKFPRNESFDRNSRIDLIENCKEDEIFITKWAVIPVFYRDVDRSNGRISIPELNYEYNKLIQYTTGLDDDIFAFYNIKLLYNVQLSLINIRRYGQKLIEKKHGAFHQTILGKTIDRGSRDVISTPIMNHYEKPEDNPIDMFHVGIPLSKCIVLGYDFMIKYCLDFFYNNFNGVRSFPVYKKENGELKIDRRIPIKNQLQIYTKSRIDKQMKKFINTFGSRFEEIKIYAADGTEFPMHFTGNFQPTELHNPAGSTIINRSFTWADLFYLAAMETLSDKYVYITRYPITTYSGIYPAKCYPLSTVKTKPVFTNGKFYKEYPDINPKMPQDEVATKFIDTVTMSNLFLPALGGDYDGDTVSGKMVFSLEANKEGEEITHSIKHFISAEGKLIREVGNEAYLTFYAMTKRAK